jgi:hypothetical protein
MAGYFMEIHAKISIDLKGLKKFREDVNAQLNGQIGPVHSALKLWAVRYRSFAQIRFDLYSKGGGDWQQLALSTIKKRRQGTVSNVKKLRQIRQNQAPKYAGAVSTGGVYSILRDTGLLFGALDPIFQGAPGAIQDEIPFGIRVGYGGPQRYTIGNKQSTATIADIAEFHQLGNLPKLPQRKIIVDPPQDLINEMAEDMTKALLQVALQNGGH